MKLAEHKPLLRQCAAVVAVLGLCAGGIAWLHARAAPGRRQRSPAELGLARRLPEIKLKDASLGEVLRAMSDGSEEFHTRGLDDKALQHRNNYWSPAGATLEEALREMPKQPFSGLHIRPERRRLIIEPQATAPLIVRTFEVGSLIDSLCAEVPEAPELPWPMPPARERLRDDVPRIACWRIGNQMGGWQASYIEDATLVGDHLVVHATFQMLQLVQRQIDELRNASTRIPPPSVLAALDAELPKGDYVRGTLREHIVRILGKRVTYRVDWEALGRLGIKTDLQLGFAYLYPDVSANLHLLLQVAVTERNELAEGEVDSNALSFGIDGDVLVISTRDKLPLVRRTYSLDFLWTHPDGAPLTAQDKSTFDRAYFQVGRGLDRLDNVIVWKVRNRLIVIGDEYAHSIARRDLERARREWKAGTLGAKPLPKY